jgi:pyruvate dehydrogenase E2 component (dihydrolipoamide acetyltransferase)
MATEFFIPKLGQTVEEVTIVSWSVEDGQKLNFGDQVMEVETDKAVFPVEANAKGFVHLGPYKAGDVVPVLTVVAVIGAKDDTFAGGTIPAAEEVVPEAAVEEQAQSNAAPTQTEESSENEKLFASPRARKLANEKGVNLSQVVPTGERGRRVAERDVLAFLKHAPKVTPLAQRMATASGVDVASITGSGPGGKIVKEDIARAAAAREAQPVTPVSSPSAAAPLPEAEVLERVPLSGVRSIIANRMSMSVNTTARVTLVTEVDATEFVAARTRLKERVEQDWGFAPGYNDLLARIAASALRKFPYMNARLSSDAIEYLAHVNIGMAVDTERGCWYPSSKTPTARACASLAPTCASWWIVPARAARCPTTSAAARLPLPTWACTTSTPSPR